MFLHILGWKVTNLNLNWKHMHGLGVPKAWGSGHSVKRQQPFSASFRKSHTEEMLYLQLCSVHSQEQTPAHSKSIAWAIKTRKCVNGFFFRREKKKLMKQDWIPKWMVGKWKQSRRRTKKYNKIFLLKWLYCDFGGTHSAATFIKYKNTLGIPWQSSG